MVSCGRLTGRPTSAPSFHLHELLATAEQEVLVVADQILSDRVLADVARLWEAGWQPADLDHVTARVDRRIAALAAAAAVRQSQRAGTLEHAPESWRDQLDDCVARARSAGLAAPDGSRWRAVQSLQRTGLTHLESWAAAVGLVCLAEGLPRLESFLPPPSAWSTAASAGAAGPARSTDGRDKVLPRIRALLAKAEATPYAAEAEAFTSKAQELMTRHAIDEALVRAATRESIDVSGRRIHIDAPYLTEKTSLVNAVGRANRARVVWREELAIATVIGTPTDVDQVEMLFVSLLVQATRAMTAAGASRRSGSFDRSASFRRSFLAAYAARIGERLSAADQAATSSYGSDLVPLLRRQQEAVDAEFERLFPHTRAAPGRRWYDGRGWAAGREAADKAVIVAGRLAG